MGLFSFLKKDCEVCGTKDVKNLLAFPVLKGRATRKNLCRVHFFEEYKKAFLNHPYKMVILYPALDKWNSVYGFYALSEMKTYAYQDDDVEMVKKVLASIPAGKDCAYFDQEASKVATLDGPWQSAALLRPSDSQYLTKAEGFNKIQSVLSISQRNFSDGFTVPYGEEGVFLTSLL